MSIDRRHEPETDHPYAPCALALAREVDGRPPSAGLTDVGAWNAARFPEAMGHADEVARFVVGAACDAALGMRRCLDAVRREGGPVEEAEAIDAALAPLQLHARVGGIVPSALADAARAVGDALRFQAREIGLSPRDRVRHPRSLDYLDRVVPLRLDAPLSPGDAVSLDGLAPGFAG